MSAEEKSPGKNRYMVDINELPPDYLDPGIIIEFPAPRRGISMITRTIPLQLLYSGYMQGAFPWFNEDEGEPVVWHSPQPRFCLRMEDLHISRSIDRFLKHSPYAYTMDKDFAGVIEGCRKMNRKGQDGTWIGQKIMDAYCAFHKKGYAHSFEAWDGNKLSGGLYGVLIGSVFFGESMFTIGPDSSKSTFAVFARAFSKCGGKLIDSQVYTDNMARYGAKNISRDAFLRLEGEYLYKPLEGNLADFFSKEAAMSKKSPKDG